LAIGVNKILKIFSNKLPINSNTRVQAKRLLVSRLYLEREIYLPIEYWGWVKASVVAITFQVKPSELNIAARSCGNMLGR